MAHASRLGQFVIVRHILLSKLGWTAHNQAMDHHRYLDEHHLHHLDEHHLAKHHLDPHHLDPHHLDPHHLDQHHLDQHLEVWPAVKSHLTSFNRACEAALVAYRLGYSTGATSVIMGLIPETFNLVWVPKDDVISKARLTHFIEDFKSNAEANGRPKFFMKFANIIHRQVRYDW